MRRGGLAGAVMLAMATTTAAVAGPTPSASPSPPPGDRGVEVQALLAGPGGRVYAVEHRFGCSDNCVRLTRTLDWGAHWGQQPARGWSVGSLIVSGSMLVSLDGSGALQVSRDGGGSFRTLARLSDADALDGRHEQVAVGTSSGGGYLIDLRSGTARVLPASGYQTLRLALHPDWPALPAGDPGALATAIDPSTGFPVLLRCDARLACGRPVVVATRKDVAEAWLSPSFARDHLVFVTTVHGGFFRSTDGGASLRPVTVAPPSPRQLIQSVQALAFGGGAVYVGVLAVASIDRSSPPSGQSTQGTVSGGVYRSLDGGATWTKVGGASPLDNGVTALAYGSDGKLFAAYVKLPSSGGTVCTTDLAHWQAACPGSTRAGEPSGAQLPTPAGATATGGANGAASSKRSPGAEQTDLSDAARTAARSSRGGIGTKALGGGLAVLVAGAAGALIARRRRRRSPS